MSSATSLIALVWVCVSLYAMLGGADFGAGALHLIARRAGDEHQRETVATTMGPVWEANHVWLIFAVTVLFSAFPRAFGILGSALFLPGTIVVLAIVLRGVAFSFASAAEGDRRMVRRLHGVFESASVAAPLVFGTIAGGLARQQIRVDHGAVHGGGAELWIGWFQLAVGLLAVAFCVALAAGFMSVQASRTDDAALVERFRRHALEATAAVAALALTALALAHEQAPALFDGLTGAGLPAVLVAILTLSTALGALWRRRLRLARLALWLAITAVIWGWGLAQYPRIAGPDVTVRNAAASSPELTAILVAIGGGLVLLAPAAWLLYVAFRRDPVEVN
jgi:cytochrome d ubiquinol oxidase subunit II